MPGPMSTLGRFRSHAPAVSYNPVWHSLPHSDIMNADGEADMQLGMALKEWAVVCDELLAGRQIVLLRKGGILEQRHGPSPRRSGSGRAGGFSIEHPVFWLYPNTAHESRNQVKPALHARLDAYPPPAKESGKVFIPGYGQVVDIVKTADAAKLRALEPLTCWTQALFDMRINYKPEKPNYVVTVRAYKLPRPIEVPYHEDYAGCHSWVPLKAELDATGTPVLDDDEFETKRKAVLKVIGE